MKADHNTLPKQVDLSRGSKWVFEGHVVEIDGIESGSIVSVRIEATSEIRRVAVAALSAIPSSKPQSNPHAIPSDEWARITAIARDIDPLTVHNRVPRELLAKVANAHRISERHVQRLLATFRQNPRVSTLAKRKVGRPATTRLLAPAVEQVITHVIQKHYLKREPISQEEAVARTRSICRRCGLSPPSRGSVRRRIAQYRDRAGDMRRLGPKRTKQRWEPRPGLLFVERPLDVVQIDHTRVDIMVLSDDRRDVLGRPWLTVAIDVATRVVLGFYLSMDPPSAASVGLCIAHAALPKPEDARDPGLWPMFGKMKLIHVDNGKDLVSAAIRRGCDEHGIALETRPLGKPHYGGHIERLMGTLMKMVHGLPGTTFSNIKEKGDYDSERKATLTLMELHEWMLQKIGRSYHARVHRMLGVAPLVAWERSWRSEAGQVVLPPLIARQDEFRLDFLPFQQRRVQRTGIQLWGSRYWSEPLCCLVHPTRVAQVHYHPYALERVWVRAPDDRVIEAHAVAGPAAGYRRPKAMNAAEREHVEMLQDKGFAACDRIEAMAASATRAQIRRESSKASKNAKARLHGTHHQRPCLDNSLPDVPLDQSSVQVKRFV